jgi:hypothetical protein
MFATKPIFNIALAALFALSSMYASAHHSAAGYDTDKRIEVSGTITKVSFRNPHGKLKLANATAEGYSDGDWKVEAAAANLLRRRGWNFKEIKQGMKIKLVGHPTKDGGHELYLREVHFEDGTVFGDPDGQDKALD